MASLDNSFGNNGKVVTTLGGLDTGLGLVLQSDGKILVAGLFDNGVTQDFALIRYNSSGSLDSSFDLDGKVNTDFSSDPDVGQTVVLQTDSKILVGGRATIGFDDDFAIARYNSDGSLDTSFDLDGQLTQDFDLGNDEITGIRLQADGKILAAGTANIQGNDDFALIRLNSNGTADTSFSTDGEVTVDFDGAEDDANDLLLQPDGKILLVGDARMGVDRDFALARFNTDGTLDTSFGNGGKVTTDFAGFDDTALATVLQSDGKILVAGSSKTAFGSDFALVRYTSNGTLDTSFGNGGKVTTDFAGFDDGVTGLHVQPDGKIVVTGTAQNGSNSDFGIVRYNSNGTVDSSFGTNGKLVTDFGKGEIAAESVLQDGILTIVGSSFDNASSSVALARYLLNQKPTDLSLSSLTVAENQSIGSTVGTFSTTDPDAGDTFTYALIAGAGGIDNSAFEIVGNTLKTKQTFDFETKTTYSIRVKTTDAYGTSTEKELKIAVGDIEEKITPEKPKSEVGKVSPGKPKPKGDPIVGTRKNDRLVGTAEDDLIHGLRGKDKLVGRASNDILVGGADNDILKGGVGDDLLRGGKGRDICFLQNNGIDTIQGFSDGQDKLKLTGGLTFSNLVITQQDSDVLIGVGTSKFALLSGINVSQITATDFV